MSFSTFLKKLAKVLLWVVLPILLLVGAWLLARTLIPKPAVGIIRLDMEIWSASAEYIHYQIQAAREDSRIKAVVLRLDTPGGEVVATQNIYLELQGLRQEMPVVGSIDTVAASGGYYAAMAADPIYARPSSSVGNVGVWSIVPDDLAVNDEIIASGPFKLTGSNREEFMRELEGIKQEFLNTVSSQRGERLKITPEELSQGLIYSGREAARLGLIDRVGSNDEAIAEAAKQAHIENYDEIDLSIAAYQKLLENYGYSHLEEPELEAWIGAADPLTGERTLPYGIYLLYDARLRGVP
ncbi:MAG: S49 family peptidase [Anaerolineae bacterium]|jgi:protease-4